MNQALILLLFLLSFTSLNASANQVLAAHADYYAALGVHPNANGSEIKEAYKKKAMEFHPDRNPGLHGAKAAENEERMKLINEAYSVLKDETKRAEYDRLHIHGATLNDSAKIRTAHSSAEALDDLLRQMNETSEEEKIIDLLKQLRSFGPFLYSNGVAFDRFYEVMRGYSEYEKFGTLATARRFFDMTDSWNYGLYLSGGSSFVTWAPQYQAILKTLLLRGNSVEAIVSMIDGASASKYASNRFRLDIMHAQVIFKTLFEYRLVTTAPGFISSSELLRPLFQHEDLINKLHGSLSGLFQYVHPFVAQLSAEQRMDLSLRVGTDPIETLALMESVLQSQRQDRRLTGRQLTEFLGSLIEHRELVFNFDTYFRSKGVDQNTIAKWRAEGRAKNWNMVPEARAGQMYKRDIVKLLSRYSDVLEDLDFKAIAEHLGVMEVALRSGILLRKFSFAKGVSWIDQLPKASYKEYVPRDADPGQPSLRSPPGSRILPGTCINLFSGR